MFGNNKCMRKSVNVHIIYMRRIADIKKGYSFLIQLFFRQDFEQINSDGASVSLIMLQLKCLLQIAMGKLFIH